MIQRAQLSRWGEALWVKDKVHEAYLPSTVALFQLQTNIGNTGRDGEVEFTG